MVSSSNKCPLSISLFIESKTSQVFHWSIVKNGTQEIRHRRTHDICHSQYCPCCSYCFYNHGSIVLTFNGKIKRRFHINLIPHFRHTLQLNKSYLSRLVSISASHYGIPLCTYETTKPCWWWLKKNKWR